MKKFLLLFALTLCVSSFSQVVAQNPPAGEMHGPPKVVLIVREEIKPGMMDTHNRHSAEFAGLFGKLQTPNHRIALVPVAGDENEVIYLTGAETFAELEKIQTDTDKKMSSVNAGMQGDLDRLGKEAPALHAGMRDMFAVLRPDLSFGPNVVLPTMRYMAVTTVRVRPGQEDQYVEYVKNLVNAAREKAKAELHIAGFQVIAGSPSGTFMFFRPMKSLAEYDLRIGPRVREAMSDDQRKKADKMAGESIMTSETSIYALSPRLSYVEKEFAAVDPTFWNAKPEVATKPKPKKRAAPAPPPAN
jgi:hypothetical protein